MKNKTVTITFVDYQKHVEMVFSCANNNMYNEYAGVLDKIWGFYQNDARQLLTDDFLITKVRYLVKLNGLLSAPMLAKVIVVDRLDMLPKKTIKINDDTINSYSFVKLHYVTSGSYYATVYYPNYGYSSDFLK